MALAARSFDFTARSSCWSRVTLPVAYFSVLEPMRQASKAHHRPSLMIASASSVLPYRNPDRAPSAMYGALVIDSMPPATTMSASPAAIIWWAR